MKTIRTSPLLSARLSAIPGRMTRIKNALKDKNFRLFGEILEKDCLDMHAVMQTQNPPLNYLADATKTIMEAVRSWRIDGLEVYFTIDAGPNVHIMCQGKDEKCVLEKVKTVGNIESIIVNKPAPGTHLIKTHLFDNETR